jgi:hypothetical protein
MTHAAAGARRNLIILLAVIAILVIVSLVVVFTRGEPELLDESTPEGVVQRYAMAVVDGDDDQAADYLSDSARDQCGTVEGTLSDDLRVTLVSTDQREDSADVRVQISRNTGGAFGSEYSYEEDFRLVQEGDNWLIETVPWELAVCVMVGDVQ